MPRRKKVLLRKTGKRKNDPRSPEAGEFSKLAERNEDRISRYLSPRIRDMMFGELSPDYLERIQAAELLGGVPVPVNTDGSGEAGVINVKSIVLDMARVIGVDPLFVYADKYAEFIKHAAGENAESMLVSEGARSADEGDLEDACMLLRAALRIDPKSRDAMYLYARACKECYETEAAASADGMGDEEKIGLFKAESMETFELLTMIHPDFAMGYYFLGYAYLNMGLYLKAQLTWKEFLELSSGSVTEAQQMDDELLPALRDEVSGRVEELSEPVEIERGCNMVMSGDYQGGRELLNGFRESRYAGWWPLWYYLAAAESALGNTEKAVEYYKRVLVISPSNTDAMEELAAIYALSGDEENAAKYRNKIRIVRSNLEAEAAESEQ